MNAGESTTKSFPGTAAPPRAASPPDAVTPPSEPTVVAPARHGLVRVRWVVIAVMIGLAVFIAVRLWMIEGLALRRVTIKGPSMAPAFLGAHYRVTCADCGFGFSCDATDVPASGLAVCPNCGYRANELTAAALQPGERVIVDRWQALWRGPARGDVIAARQPGKEELLIKRVAGLPGERLQINGGDLHVGGQIVRKSLREWREVRVLVHDNAFQPRVTPDLPARWQAKETGSSWQADGAGFRVARAEGELDWLEYHHWRCTESPAPRTQLVPVLDNDSFNQNQSRQLNPVTDVVLSCRVLAEGDGRLALAATGGNQRLEVIVDFGRRRLTLSDGGKSLAEKSLAAELFRGPVSLEFGLCDRQVLLVVGGRQLLLAPYDPAFVLLGSTAPHPLAIGASSLAVEISDLKVWRDIYYLEPLGTPRSWQAERPLAVDQYALFGDNPPVSIDARHFPGSGGIAHGELLGPVERPFWSRVPRD